jgi:hypothetical protein
VTLKSLDQTSKAKFTACFAQNDTRWGTPRERDPQVRGCVFGHNYDMIPWGKRLSNGRCFEHKLTNVRQNARFFSWCLQFCIPQSFPQRNVNLLSAITVKWIGSSPTLVLMICRSWCLDYSLNNNSSWRNGVKLSACRPNGRKTMLEEKVESKIPFIILITCVKRRLAPPSMEGNQFNLLHKHSQWKIYHVGLVVMTGPSREISLS